MDKKREETKHRTELYAEANKHRCMRRGTGSKYVKVKEKCTGPNYLDLVRRVDRQGEVSIWCRKCSGHARQRMGPLLMNGLQARASWHKIARQNVKNECRASKTAGSLPKGQKTGRLKDKKGRITRKES